MKALTRARKARGLSLTQAAADLGMSEQQLRNLERIGHTRTTSPADIKAHTMVRILTRFRELDVSDFVAGATISLKGRKRT